MPADPHTPPPKASTPDEVRAALAEAGPSPWLVDPGGWDTEEGALFLSIFGGGVHGSAPEYCVANVSNYGQGIKSCEADAHLIANAPTWLAQLLAALEAAELREQVEKARAIRRVAAPISRAVAGSMRREMESIADKRDAAVAALEASERENERLRAISDAAKAEVLAQGYRSSDMARALKALYGEFWFENAEMEDEINGTR